MMVIENENKESKQFSEGHFMLKEECVQVNEKIEECNKLKASFLHNINHEIRTPMNAIMGFIDLLKSKDISDKKKLEYINIIEKNGNKMINILNDIIYLSEIEAGLISANPKGTNLNQMLWHLYTFFNPDALEKNLVLEYKTVFADESCTIVTDESKLHQILSELLRNALKFTDSGKITFGYFPIGRSLEFYVYDTGIGIHEDKKEIIFEPFVQGVTSVSRNFEGLGIGLSIVKSYVELLGGSIWLESELGKGSVFSFTIPLIWGVNVSAKVDSKNVYPF